MIQQASFPLTDATHLTHFGEQFPRPRFPRPNCSTILQDGRSCHISDTSHIGSIMSFFPRTPLALPQRCSQNSRGEQKCESRERACHSATTLPVGDHRHESRAARVHASIPSGSSVPVDIFVRRAGYAADFSIARDSRVNVGRGVQCGYGVGRGAGVGRGLGVIGSLHGALMPPDRLATNLPSAKG
jgi:hypothetical protein